MGEGKAERALKSQEIMLRRARRFVEKAAKRLNLVEAYIVGSRARGDYLSESDIDVVLVARGVKHLNSKERALLLADEAEPGVEYMVYDVEEWASEATTWIKKLREEAKKIYP